MLQTTLGRCSPPPTKVSTTTPSTTQALGMTPSRFRMEADAAEQDVSSAIAEVEEAQECLAALVESYDDSEAAHKAVEEHTAWPAEYNLNMRDVKIKMNQLARA